jgi:hypothetical protein
MLSPNLLRSLVLNLGSPTNILHSASHFALTALLTSCARDSSRAAASAVALLARGHPGFDKRTGTTAIATLVSQLDERGLAGVLKAVRAAIDGGSDSKRGKRDDDTEGADEDVRVAKRDFGKDAAVETRLAWAIQALTGGGKNARFVCVLCVVCVLRV